MTILIEYGVNTEMNDYILAIGDILYDKDNQNSYRIISLIDDHLILCEMETTKLELQQIKYTIIADLVLSNKIEIKKDQALVYDIDQLSESVRNRYILKVHIMNDVKIAYGPSYLGLMGKSSKIAENTSQIQLSYIELLENVYHLFSKWNEELFTY